MTSKRQFALGLLLGILVVGCAGFGYKYYGIEIPDGCYKDGKLLGPKESDDRPLEVCKPDEQNKGKCTVMLTDEFDRLASDYTSCTIKLKDCQRDCQ